MEKEMSLSLSWLTWSAKKETQGLNYMCDFRVGLAGGGGQRLGTFVFLFETQQAIRYLTIQLDSDV